MNSAVSVSVPRHFLVLLGFVILRVEVKGPREFKHECATSSVLVQVTYCVPEHMLNIPVAF